MHPTQLFVYGTLRHDQPEHAKYCRGVTGWRPARMRGRLGTVPSGYRLVMVSPGAVLLTATCDAAADEISRGAISAARLARAIAAQGDDPWINGELLTFRDAAEAWPTIDGWEDFSPGGVGYYARLVVPVEIMEGETPRTVSAWVYATSEPPAASLRPGQ